MKAWGIRIKNTNYNNKTIWSWCTAWSVDNGTVKYAFYETKREAKNRCGRLRELGCCAEVVVVELPEPRPCKQAHSDHAALVAELEVERMRLAACGVIARADTPSSAAKCREMHAEYRSDSLKAVEERVDECIKLRAEVTRLRAALEKRDERDNTISRVLSRYEKALEQYADKANWGYYDDSGCPKGHGSYEDACFIGSDIARKALAPEQEQE